MSQKLVRLNSNENLLGPSPMALETMQQLATTLNTYSTVEDTELAEKLAAQIGGGLSRDHFLIGNGSADVIRMIVQTYVLPDDEVLFPLPTFAIYKRLTNVHHGVIVNVPLKDHHIDLAALREAVTEKTKIIFLCNPNNPTGKIIKHDALEQFLVTLPDHVLVVIDEAYQDFVEDPEFPRTIELINKGFNIIATRTFSKVYGLASLRVGYGFGKLPVVEKVRNTRHVSETGYFAYQAAMAALRDEAHVVNSVDVAINGRNYLYQELDKLGISYLKSEALFVLLIDLPVAPDYLVAEARKHNLIIRHTDVFDMPEAVRISIGRQEDMEYAVEVLKKILS